MNLVNFCILLLSVNTALIQQENGMNNQQQARQLHAFYYGGYHPFYPFPQTHSATIKTKYPDKVQTIQQQTHIQPHYPMMGPYGISPYMGMGYINPFLSNPHFFGMNPMYSNFLAMNYMMNPMMMNPYQMNPFNMMQGMEHTTTEEIEAPKNQEDEAEQTEQEEPEKKNED